MESQFDVLIVFHATAVISDGPAQGVIQTGDILKLEEETQPTSRIIEIGWCSFDMRKQLVIDECQIFVKPSNAFILTPQQTALTGVTQEHLSKGFNLMEALSKFNDHCHYNYASHNKSFCLATLGEGTLTKILPNEVRTLGIKLPPHFFKFFDIKYEFCRFYPQTDSVQNTQDMLNYLRLRNIPLQNQCQLETKNLVRILNKLVKDKHIFISPKLLNQRYELIRAARSEDYGGRKNNTYKRWSGYIRGRSPQPFKVIRDFFIRLRGLPADCEFSDINEFLKAIRVAKKNIAFIFDQQGTFTGEGVIKMFNEMDFREALSYHLGFCRGRVVEVYESRKSDFLKAKNSASPGGEEGVNHLPLVPEGARIALIEGVSQTLSLADFKGLLSHIRIVENGLMRGVKDGIPSGKAIVILNSETDLQNLKKLDGQKLADSEFKIEEKDSTFLAEFLRTNFVRNSNLLSTKIPQVPLDKRNRTLVMHNLPNDLNYGELINIFRNDNLAEKEILMVSDDKGTFSGTALVTFDEEQDARRALKTKNLTYLRNRYVELEQLR